MTDEARSTRIYGKLWREALPALRRNELCPEPLPEPGSPRWGVSAILRTDADSETARGLLRAAEEVGRPAGSHHVIYGPAQLHVTLRSIEGYRGAVRGDDPAVERYARCVEEEARGHGPFQIRFSGLAPTTSGVLAQGWAVGRELQRLRTRLHGRLREAAPAGPETKRPRVLAHASLLLFTGPLSDAAGTVAALEAHRETEFGMAVFDRIEIVALERDSTDARIVPLRDISLGD